MTIQEQPSATWDNDSDKVDTPRSSEATAVSGTDTMAPVSTLDLLFITFNCAKNFINPAVFANHLHGALLPKGGNETGLPDLVVFSLQEVAPISYAFVGGYLVNRYYAPYEEALNAAAARVLTTTSTSSSTATATTSSANGNGATAETLPSPQPPTNARTSSFPYTMVRARNVGMTAILLFARDPARVRHIREAQVGFGTQDMGNKGAVGLRVAWAHNNTSTTTSSSTDRDAETETELTFVATHLAHGEWNLKKRNANWKSIVEGLTFADPREALPGVFSPTAPKVKEITAELPSDRPPSPTDASSSDGSEEEEGDAVTDTAPLLPRRKTLYPDHPGVGEEHIATLQDLSVFKPTSHLFIGGDLNYRISSSTPQPGSTFPTFYVEEEDERHYSHFLGRDQLTTERKAGRSMTGLEEAEIKFGPSYKYDVLGDDEVAEAENKEMVEKEGEVPWRWAGHRWPSWCDRVLYLDLPPWTRRRVPGVKVEVRGYDMLPLMRSSDHRPVYLRASVPLLPTRLLTRPSTSGPGGELSEEEKLDPRITLPFPIDPHAWERRKMARKLEVAAGWSALVWTTKEGAGVIAFALLLAGATWWVWRVL